MKLRLTWWQKAFLVLVAFIAASLAFKTVALISVAQEQAANQAAQAAASAQGMKYLAAGLAVGLAGIGGGYAVGVAGAAATSAVVEKPEVSGTVLLYVALGEGIAIYGLLIAILLILVA